VAADGARSVGECSMARYLVVAYQTATSAELVKRLQHLAAEDREAVFTLLVPATDPSHLVIWEDGDPVVIASRTAEAARQLLASRGLTVDRTVVGAASPLQAISDALNADPGGYKALIFCTLPPGMSHWLGLDLPAEVAASVSIPVHQVEAGGAFR
jgi:hypothetical protein